MSAHERSQRTPPIKILLVEDHPGDVRLAREALREARICVDLRVARDGDEALAVLRGDVGVAEAPAPELILLDLNLPKKGGLEVLEAIKNDAALKRIPVVVLTTSTDEHDILGAYNRHANCYITKPADMDQFIAVVQSVSEFWFGSVRLPPSSGAWGT